MSKIEEKLFLPFIEKWSEIQKKFREDGHYPSHFTKQSEMVANNLQAIKEGLAAAKDREEHLNNDFQQLIRLANEFLEEEEPFKSCLRKILLEIKDDIEKVNAEPQQASTNLRLNTKLRELAQMANDFHQHLQTTLHSSLRGISKFAIQIQNLMTDPVEGPIRHWKEEVSNKFQQLIQMANEFLSCSPRILKIAYKVGEEEPFNSCLRKILSEIEDDIKKVNPDPQQASTNFRLSTKLRKLAQRANDFLQHLQTTEPLHSSLRGISEFAIQIQNLMTDPVKGHIRDWKEEVSNKFQQLNQMAIEFLSCPPRILKIAYKVGEEEPLIEDDIKKVNSDPQQASTNLRSSTKLRELDQMANDFLQHLQTAEPLHSSLRGISEFAAQIQNLVTDPVEGHNRDWEEEVSNKFQELIQMVNEFLSCPLRILKLAYKVGEIKVPRPGSMSSTSSWKGQEKEETETYTNWGKPKFDESSPAMADARASYKDLEAQLKLCFLSLSIFPENSEIKKRDVIYWWMGNDLLRERRKDGTTMEDIGEDCFLKLVESGLIEPMYRKCSNSVHSCRLHPWIRWMAISIAKESFFFDFDDEGMPTGNCSRGMCLATDEKKKQVEVSSPSDPSNRFDPSKLRSLFNINVHYLKCDKEKFSVFKKITVLHLGRWQNWPKHHIELENTDILNALGLLKSLRYLGLQGISRITELPKSIAKLTNLMVLDLRACHNLETLSGGIKSLKKLRHLDVSECYLLDHMPKGLGSLSELRVLKGFVIATSRSKDPCRLNELTKLENLRKLTMSIGSEAVIVDEELNSLLQIKSLESLTITWGTMKLPSSRTLKKTGSIIKKPSRKFERTESATPLSLPSNLKKLDLRCFPEQTAPMWLMPDKLTSLKRLYFRGGKLSSFQEVKDSKVWQVETLRLKFLEELDSEWAELKRVFQNVKVVEIIKCPKIKNFIGDKDGVWLNREEASTSNSNSTPAAQNQTQGEVAGLP